MRGGGVFAVRRRASVPGAGELALRVLVNSALGFGAVWLLNLTAAVTGIRLGLNVFNAIFIGVLGVPGFGLLLLLQWVLM
mgnify:CR=1 FL=1